MQEVYEKRYDKYAFNDNDGWEIWRKDCEGSWELLGVLLTESLADLMLEAIKWSWNEEEKQ